MFVPNPNPTVALPLISLCLLQETARCKSSKREAQSLPQSSYQLITWKGQIINKTL